MIMLFINEVNRGERGPMDFDQLAGGLMMMMIVLFIVLSRVQKQTSYTFIAIEHLENTRSEAWSAQPK